MTTQLAPIQLDDGTVIYVQATDAIVPPLPAPTAVPVEQTRSQMGRGDKGVLQDTMRAARGLVSEIDPKTTAVQSFQAIEGTIKAYTYHTLNAFKQVAGANVDKVTLEFGIEVGGEVGVPYVTKGTADCNLKITVECTLPK
ncbi:CU044_2847 family protein [Almyronema epifaneia]|uniref:CU044_2847 family protein n=1 Tax=Almyronema epifaneia S1 TaxID=2991925 RepID=A0ABW6IIN4_9CYAN